MIDFNNPTCVTITNIEYLTTMDYEPMESVTIVSVQAGNSKQRLFLRNDQNNKLLRVGNTIVIKGNVVAKNKLTKEYSMWKNMAAYKRAIHKK